MGNLTHLRKRTRNAREVPGTLRRRPRLHSKLSRGGWVIPEKFAVDLDEPIDRLDLSSRPARILMQLGIRSVGKLLDYSKEKLRQEERFGKKSMAEAETKIWEYLLGSRYEELGCWPGTDPGVGTSLPGTKTFVCRMLSFVPERDRNVIADRYGLWDGKMKTLTEIGNRLGLTRERIRQIEEINLTRLRRIFGTLTVKNLLKAKVSSSGARKFWNRREFLINDRVVASLADDCTFDEATLALLFLRDIESD